MVLNAKASWQSDFQWAPSNRFIAYPFVEDTLYKQSASTAKAIKRLFVDVHVRYAGTYQDVYLASFSYAEGQLNIKLVLDDDSVLIDTAADGVSPNVSVFGPWTLYVWQKGLVIVTCVLHTASLVAATYTFDDLRIQPSCVSCLQTLVGIKVGDTVLTGNITIAPYYNMAAEVKPGTIALNCIPGGGIGYPPRTDCNCSDAAPLKAINNTKPAPNGNLSLTGDDCLSVRIPLDHTSDFDAFYHRANTLRITGDCVACCSCQDYIDKYEELRTVWARIYNMRPRINELISKYNALRDKMIERCSTVHVCATTLTAIPKPGWVVSLKAVANFGTGAEALAGKNVTMSVTVPNTPFTHKVIPGSCYVFTPDGGRQPADNETLTQRVVRPVVGTVVSLDCQLYFVDTSRNILEPITATFVVTADGEEISRTTTTFSLLASFNRD